MFFDSRMTRQRYERNLRQDLSPNCDERGMLNGQGRGALSGMHFGRSSVAHAGCESIAVYNALQMLGIPRPLAEVIRDMEQGGYMRLWGHMGAVPYFRPLLRRYGADSRLVPVAGLRRDASLGLVRPGSVYLISVWNDRWRPYRGLHTFAGTYDPQPGLPPWLIFNRFNEDRAARRYPEIPDVLKNGKTRGAYLVIYEVRRLAEKK